MNGEMYKVGLDGNTSDFYSADPQLESHRED
jgi:hypothetical protein